MLCKKAHILKTRMVTIAMLVFFMLFSCYQQKPDPQREFIKVRLREEIRSIDDVSREYKYQSFRLQSKQNAYYTYYDSLYKRVHAILDPAIESVGTDQRSTSTSMVYVYKTYAARFKQFTDTLRQHTAHHFLEADIPQLSYTPMNFDAYLDEADTGFVRLNILTELKYQELKFSRLLLNGPGCMLGVIPVKFENLLVCYNNVNKDSSITITIQESRLRSLFGGHYLKTNFHTLKRFEGQDTTLMDAHPVSVFHNPYTVISGLRYKAGHYKLTVSLEYENPAGDITVDYLDLYYELK